MYDVRMIFLFDAILFAMKVGTGAEAMFASGVSSPLDGERLSFW